MVISVTMLLCTTYGQSYRLRHDGRISLTNISKFKEEITGAVNRYCWETPTPTQAGKTCELVLECVRDCYWWQRLLNPLLRRYSNSLNGPMDVQIIIIDMQQEKDAHVLSLGSGSQDGLYITDSDEDLLRHLLLTSREPAVDCHSVVHVNPEQAKRHSYLVIIPLDPPEPSYANILYFFGYYYEFRVRDWLSVVF